MTLVPPNKRIAEGRLQPKLIRFPGAIRRDGKQTSLAKPGAASVYPRRLSKVKIVLGKDQHAILGSYDAVFVLHRYHRAI